MKVANKNFPRNLNFKIGIFIGFLFVFIGYCVYSFLTYHEPEFFPFNDEQASYSIIQSPSPYNFVEDATPAAVLAGLPNKFYLVRYKGAHIFSLKNVTTLAMLVGKSSIDLAPYVGKQVVLKGSFVRAESQCIQEICVRFNNENIVINIDMISEK